MMRRVDFYRPVRSQPIEFALLQHSQQLWLQGQWDFAHLIQQECASVGQFEFPWLRTLGASKRTFCIAEQFAFQKLLRKSRTVDRNQGTITAQAQTVNHPRQQFLPGAALRLNKHIGIARCDLHGPFDSPSQGGGMADDF
jgi:hypothetical protein